MTKKAIIDMKYYECDKETLNEDWYQEYLLVGHFFTSEKDVSTQYIVSPKKIEQNSNITMEVYEAPLPQEDDPIIKSGDDVTTAIGDCVLLCSINMWGKYFFPTYATGMQEYYDNKKYYNEKYSSDSIISLAEAINYAIEKGMKIANIKPY